MKKPEYLGAGFTVLGFLFAWANLMPISYLSVVVGLFFCAYATWENPVYGIYLTIFFLPLTKTLNLPYFGTKIAIPEVLFAITFIVYFLKKKFVFKKENYYYFLGAFLVFTVLSVVNAVSTLNWFIETLTYFFLVIFFIFISTILDSKKKIENALKVLIVSLGAVIVIGIFGFLLFRLGISNPFVDGVRLSSTFKAVNQLSISLLVGFFLILNKSDLNKKLLWIAISILGIVVFFVSGSRMTPLVLIPFIALYLAVHFWLYGKKIPLAGALAFLLVLSLVFAPVSLKGNYAAERVVGSFKDTISVEKMKESIAEDAEVSEINKETNKILLYIKNTDTSRYYQLVAFLGMIRDYPLLGVGAGNFVNQIKNYSNSPEEWEMHNTLMGILAQVGILGFLCFIIFLAMLLYESAKKAIPKKNFKYKVYISMLLLGILASLMYTTVQFGFRNRHMWFGFALLAAINRVIK